MIDEIILKENIQIISGAVLRNKSTLAVDIFIPQRFLRARKQKLSFPWLTGSNTGIFTLYTLQPPKSFYNIRHTVISTPIKFFQSDFFVHALEKRV